MKGNCGECSQRWTCQIDPDKCDVWPDPVILEFDTEAEMLAVALEDLTSIMLCGGRNMDTCNFCSNTGCYSRGGARLCEPEWHGLLKKKD